MKLSSNFALFVLTSTASSAAFLGTNAFSTPQQQSTSRSTSLSATTKPDAERVVLTGLGVVSGCGIGHENFFQSCIDGKSSLGPVTRFDASNYPCKIGSEVPDDMFDPIDYFNNPKNVRSNDRFTHFAVAAARQALQDGNVGDTPDTMENKDKVGVMVGTAFGGMETFERETLKLAKKPERPRVRTFILLVVYSCIVLHYSLFSGNSLLSFLLKFYFLLNYILW